MPKTQVKVSKSSGEEVSFAIENPQWAQFSGGYGNVGLYITLPRYEAEVLAREILATKAVPDETKA